MNAKYRKGEGTLLDADQCGEVCPLGGAEDAHT